MDEKLIELLNSEILLQIESEVSRLINFEIDPVNTEWIVRIEKQEILDSHFLIEEITSYMLSNALKIVRYTSNFLKDSEKGKLCKGFSIGYSIYLIYLEKHSAQAFKDFLKRRRIPNSLRFYSKLKKSFNEI